MKRRSTIAYGWTLWITLPLLAYLLYLNLSGPRPLEKLIECGIVFLVLIIVAVGAFGLYYLTSENTTKQELVAKLVSAQSDPCAGGKCGPGGCGPKKK